MATMKTAPAAKKTPAAKPVKFAKGKEVKVTRGGVHMGIARYVGSVEKGNGLWHEVDFEPKGSKKKDIRSYRASNLTRVG